MDNLNIVVRVLPELQSVLMAWATLFVLYLLLKKFLYKPVSKILNDRQAKIESDIEDAKLLKEESEKLKLSYKSSIEQAKKEGQDIVESARQRGEEIREDIINDAQKEAEVIITRARKDIKQEKEMAFQDIKSQVSELALLVASRIMEEEINNNKQMEWIDKFIDEVGSSKWQN